MRPVNGFMLGFTVGVGMTETVGVVVGAGVGVMEGVGAGVCTAGGESLTADVGVNVGRGGRVGVAVGVAGLGDKQAARVRAASRATSSLTRLVITPVRWDIAISSTNVVHTL